MSKERPFEDIVPVPNIRVGYFEKKEYLEIIGKQAKQIESFAYQIMALQSRIDILEKSQRPHEKWRVYEGVITCEKCGKETDEKTPFCAWCGADMRGEK
ncbi:MAG: hypothetical protein J6S67_11745 [Methanobrevibacter sp.]|nr:hypothetical protein [Methanobrevibacter sp.]